MPKILVSLSGGMDSTTLVTKAVDEVGADNVIAFGFDYQQHHREELDYAIEVAHLLDVPFRTLKIDPSIFSGSDSSLLSWNEGARYMGSYEDIQALQGAQPTVVPNRNMIFISMAVAFAISQGMDEVWLGVHAGDAYNYHYPDCRPAFMGAMAAAVDLSSEGKVKLRAPFNHLTKGQIVAEAARLFAPLEMSRSCYRDGSDYCDLHCGECATCIERAGAFVEAGFEDPTVYFTQPNVTGYGSKSARPWPVIK